MRVNLLTLIKPSTSLGCNGDRRKGKREAKGMYVQATLLDRRRYRHYKFSREIEAQMKALSTTDNWHSPLALLVDYGMIAAAALACLYASWWLYPLAVVLIGARQRGVSSILHESSHGVSARSAALRGVLGTVLTAYPIFQTFYAYKISHVLTHHPQLGRRELDADLQFFIGEDVFKPVSPRRYFWRMMVLPQLGLRTFAYFRSIC